MSDLVVAPTLDSWPVREVASFPCSPGYGMCVSERLNIVIVSTYPENCLEVYDMRTGMFRNRIAEFGRGPGRLHFTRGDMCTHPPDASNDAGFTSTFAKADDVVVVADSYNSRLSQFNVHTGAWIRHIGEAELGARDERCPEYVACTMHTVVAMSDYKCSVFDWVTGRHLHSVAAQTRQNPFRSSLHVTVAKTDDGTVRDIVRIVATTQSEGHDMHIVVMNPPRTKYDAIVYIPADFVEPSVDKASFSGVVATDTASSSLFQVYFTSWYSNVYRVLLPLNGQGGAVQIQHVPLPGSRKSLYDVKSCASGRLCIRSNDRVYMFCEWRLRLYWIWIAATLHTTIEIP